MIIELETETVRRLLSHAFPKDTLDAVILRLVEVYENQPPEKGEVGSNILRELSEGPPLGLGKVTQARKPEEVMWQGSMDTLGKAMRRSKGPELVECLKGKETFWK